MSGVSPVGADYEGRQNVGVNIDRTLLERIEIVFHAGHFAPPGVLLRQGRVAQLERRVLDAEVRDGTDANHVVLALAVEIRRRDRNVSVVLDVQSLQLLAGGGGRVEHRDQYAAALSVRGGDRQAARHLVPDGNFRPVHRHFDTLLGAGRACRAARHDPVVAGGNAPLQRLAALVVNIHEVGTAQERVERRKHVEAPQPFHHILAFGLYFQPGLRCELCAPQFRELEIGCGESLLHCHYMVPLAAEQGVVSRRDDLQAVVAHAAFGGQRIGRGTLLRGIPAVLLSAEHHAVEQFARLHRIVEHLVEARFVRFGHSVHQRVDLPGDPCVVFEPPVGLAVIGEGEVGVRIPLLAVLVRGPLVAPAHEFGLADECEVVERVGNLPEPVEILPAQQAAHPLGAVIRGPPEIERVDVPGHRQEEIDRKFTRLDIAGVQQPYAVGRRVVGFAQLLVHQRRRGGVHPEVIVRTAQVGRMIVDARTPGTFLLRGTAQAFHVAVVVVGPDDRHIVGELQSPVVDIEHLLVGGEHLRNLLRGSAQHVCQNMPLRQQGFLHGGLPCVEVLAAGHGPVMQTPQGQRVDVLIGRRGFDALLQHPVHSGPVVHVVPFAHGLRIPFAGGVQPQRFAVRRAYGDGVTVGDLFVFGYFVESRRCVVHRRGQVVRLQAEQQFAHLLVGLRADVAQLLFEVLLRPAVEAPVLVVDEDAAVFHRGAFRREIRDAQRQPVAVFHGGVRPPVPRAHADGARHREQTVGRAAAVAARNDQRFAHAVSRTVDQPDCITFPAAFDGRNVDPAGRDQFVDPAALTDRSDDHGAARLCGKLLPGDDRNFAARYAGDIRGEQPGGGFHNRGVPGVVTDGRAGIRGGQLEVRACGGLPGQRHLRLQGRGLHPQQG